MLAEPHDCWLHKSNLPCNCRLHPRFCRLRRVRPRQVLMQKIHVLLKLAYIGPLMSFNKLLRTYNILLMVLQRFLMIWNVQCFGFWRRECMWYNKNGSSFSNITRWLLIISLKMKQPCTLWLMPTVKPLSVTRKSFSFNWCVAMLEWMMKDWVIWSPVELSWLDKVNTLGNSRKNWNRRPFPMLISWGRRSGLVERYWGAATSMFRITCVNKSGKEHWMRHRRGGSLVPSQSWSFVDSWDPCLSFLADLAWNKLTKYGQ